MGRYTGPRERLSRRAGVDLELKGERRAARKGGLERRPYPPGEHGRRSGRRPSTYSLQLHAKQAAKRYYGVRERQFRRYVREAQRTVDALTGDRLLQLLELRLDNTLVRLGFAATRAQARQFVVHGHVEVNGRRCDIPSRRLRDGRRGRDPAPAAPCRAARPAPPETDRPRAGLAAGGPGVARGPRGARAAPRRDPGARGRAADRRVLQPRLRGAPMLEPMPFALHATSADPTHAELAALARAAPSGPWTRSRSTSPWSGSRRRCPSRPRPTRSSELAALSALMRTDPWPRAADAPGPWGAAPAQRAGGRARAPARAERAVAEVAGAPGDPARRGEQRARTT